MAAKTTKKKITLITVPGKFNDVRLSHKMAYSLSRTGYDVTLVAGQAGSDSYLGMVVRKTWAPFRTSFRFVLNAPFLIIQALRIKSDLYILSNPDTIPLALVLRLFGKKVLYDTAEDFSKRPLIKVSIPERLRPAACTVLTSLERFLSRRVDLISVTQRQQLDSFGDNTILIENTPLVDGPVIADALAITKSMPKPEVFSLIYVGGITAHRGIFNMLDLLGRLNDDIECKLMLVGFFGDRDCERQARQHKAWSLVDFHGHVPHAQALAHICRSHLGLALLDDVADYSTSSITKLYEYMWAGIPFIATDFQCWRRPLDGVSAGHFVDPRDTDTIISHVIEIAENPGNAAAMGSAGREFIASTLNWSTTGARLTRSVNGILCKQSDLE